MGIRNVFKAATDDSPWVSAEIRAEEKPYVRSIPPRVHDPPERWLRTVMFYIFALMFTVAVNH